MASPPTPRPIVIRSVFTGQPALDEQMRDGVYLDEIDRQAGLVTHELGQAFLRAVGPDPDQARVWGHLQASLFAAIVVCRLLNPGAVRTYPGHDRRASQQYADERGRRLRQLLDVDDDEPVLQQVLAVRNALEHFDEYLDARLIQRPSSLVDWNISDGIALATGSNTDGVHGFGLRVYFPEGGVLHVDQQALDLFALDGAMLETRDRRRALPKPNTDGTRTTFGGQQAVRLMEHDVAQARCTEWLSARERAGVGLNAKVVPIDPA